MKKITFVLFTLISINAYSQYDSTSIGHNNVSAFISDAGSYFYNYENQKRGYEIPKGSNIHALKSMQLWFAAKDDNGEIFFSQGGVPGQGRDIFNGPISHPMSYDSHEYTVGWDKSIWKICQSTIDKYKSYYDCNQDPNCTDNYSFTNEELDQIMNWPAHGDIQMSQSFYLAPFVEHPNGNLDGIYDPLQGDLPSIKGCCATYSIQNDEAQVHSYTNSSPIGIELHVMVYQFRTWDNLNNVTFIDVKAINYSMKDYPEFVHSVAIDAVLGNETDDYFGSDSLTNTMFFYNADNNDESNSMVNGYGQNPPAIGIVGLDQMMTSSVPFTGNESITEKWNLMKGLQSNGDTWINPNGHDTKYVYSGNPHNAAEWSELTAGNNSGNRKGLLSIDFGNLNHGDTLSQSYAIVYTREGNNLENVNSLISYADEVKSFYLNESETPCTNGTLGINKESKLAISLAPNPTSGIIQLKTPALNDLKLSVYDLQGKEIVEPIKTKNEFVDIDLNGKKSGVYLIHIKSKNEKIVKKIVVR